MPSTIVVIPCFNEAARLDAAAFDRFLRSDAKCGVIFVNDGSTDETRDVLRRIETAHPAHVEILDLPANGGKAEAVRCGIRFALGRGADYVGYWDADLATPLEAVADFTRVLDRRRGTEVVIGSRVPLLGRAIRRRPRRAALGRLFARAASWVLGVPIRDTQCGAKMFRATPVIAAAFEARFRSRWIFDVELLARLAQLARQQGAPPLAECVYELPLDDWRDVGGSKLRLRDFLKAPSELAAIHLRYFSWLQGRAPRVESMPRMVIPLAEHRAEPIGAETSDSQRAAA